MRAGGACDRRRQFQEVMNGSMRVFGGGKPRVVRARLLISLLGTGTVLTGMTHPLIRRSNQAEIVLCAKVLLAGSLVRSRRTWLKPGQDVKKVDPKLKEASPAIG